VPVPLHANWRLADRELPRPRLVFHFYGRLLTPAEFSVVPAPAVAVEAVDGPPGWWPKRWSADHHASVPRYFYDCAAKQVLVATGEGLWSHLMPGAESGTVHVHIVRVDEDVALAVALLEEPRLCASPAIRRLVEIEDVLDRSGGTSCGDATHEELATNAWVFEPCHLDREAGSLEANAATDVLRAVADRVRAVAMGRGDSLDIAGDVTVRHSRGPVALVDERGLFARLALKPEGIEAYVTERSEGGRRIVTIGLTGAFVPVDLFAVYDTLNELEGPLDHDRWGGSSHIGGSPFGGTALDLGQILEVIVRHHRGMRPSSIPMDAPPRTGQTGSAGREYGSAGEPGAGRREWNAGSPHPSGEDECP
jgi:hypothetical protein